MSTFSLDDVDRAILYELQEDAHNSTNAEIAEQVGVSPSTVGKRITRLEEEGVIGGYSPEINYEAAGFPLHMMFICTAGIPEREDLIREALDIETVVNVHEMMTGQRNVHIQIVARTNAGITRTAQQIDDIGFTVNDEYLMRAEYSQPAEIFKSTSPES